RDVPRAAVVVPGLARGDAPVPRGGHRDRGLLQHDRVRRRHPGLLFHPGPPRRGAPGRRLVPGPAGRGGPAAGGRGRGDDRRPRLPPAQAHLPTGALMTTRIIAVDVHDVRFPTAAAGDGSDAINRGDYSATYVELHTDAGVTGSGLTFTNGRGNEITCAAVRALAHHVEGHTVEELFADPVAFSRAITADV